MQGAPYVILLFAGVIVSFASSIYAWIRYPIPGARIGAIIGLGATQWMLGYALELVTNDLTLMIWLNNIQYVGIGVVLLGWLLFILHYTGHERWITPRTVALLLIEPILIVTLVFTNPYHHLVWGPATLIWSNSFRVLVHDHGIAYWFHIAYTYALHTLETMLLLQMWSRSPLLQRRQVTLVLLAMLMPLLGNIVVQLGLNPWPHVDMTPLFSHAAYLTLFTMLFYLRVEDIVPIARTLVVESMSDGVIVLDEHDHLIDMNAAAQRITGAGLQAMLGTRIGAADLVWQDPLRRSARLRRPGEPREAAPDQTVDSFPPAFEVTLPDGQTERIYDVQVSPVRDWRRRLTGRAVVLRDITDRKRQEAEQQEMTDMLERARRLESVGILAGGVAHDLNNILSPLVAYPDLIMMDLPQDSGIRQDLAQIKRSAEKASAIVQDLLTLARRGTYHMTLLNLNLVVEAYLTAPSFSALKARYPQVAVSADLCPDLPSISGSEPHLSKALMNLVINAFEAMPDGGELTISTAHQRLDEPFTGYEEIDAGDYVVLSVQDTGTGIRNQDLVHLFEPFFTTKRMGDSGSGLGLSVLHGVLRDHQGRVDLQTEVGQGTTFRLYFPVALEPVTEPARPRRDYRGSETVLIIDDLEDQLVLTSRLLETLGYDTVRAQGGHAAIRYLQKNKVDILVLDMLMAPGFDGLETYREIIKIHPGQKAIIASGFAEDERVALAQELGAGPFVRKPFTRDKIGRAIRQELDRVD
ncbi:MAG: response regulator [Anaerolineae bacterium]|nr:response regulator [Anaerolineae bacterium]